MINNLLGQTLKVVGNSFRGIAGFELSFEELREICKKAWKDKNDDFPCMDKSQKKTYGKNCPCKISKSTPTECVPETNPF